MRVSGKADIDLSYCQERIEKYIQKAWDLNIPIPTTLALEDYQV